MAVESLVQDWLEDYADIDPDGLVNYALNLDNNNDLTTAVFRVLEDRNKYAELIEPVVSQLYSFYQSQCRELQYYTLQFLPSLVFVSLNCVAHGDKQSCPTVETLLLGMYNQELLDKNGKPRIYSFRLPSLAQASPYHDPEHLAAVSFTESALRRLEECNTHLVQKGPYQPVNKLIAQNRLSVMSALMVLYNARRSASNLLATEFLCKAVSRLVTQGFNKQTTHQRSSYDSSLVPPTLPRISVNAEFLLELLEAVHLALYTKYSSLAQQSLEDIHFRANHELFPDVLLVTSALRNILHIGTSVPVSETTVVNSNISPVLSGAALHKSLITNASFRTKKLPDDIEIDDDWGESAEAVVHRKRPKELLVPPQSHERGSRRLSEGLLMIGTLWRSLGKNQDDIPIQEQEGGEGSKKLEDICEEGATATTEGKPKSGPVIKLSAKLPSLVKKKSEGKSGKGGKRKTESTDETDEIIFSPEMSPPEHSDGQDFELKQRDSIV